MIILNEKEFAENCLRTGEIPGKPFHVLAVIAKYYYHCLGYRKKKIIEGLTQFLAQNYPPYKANKISWDESIEKIARNAGKYPLYEIDGMWITQQELDTIATLEDDKMERVAFTFLCLAKYHMAKNPNINGWVNDDMNDIYEMARVVCNRYQKNVYIGMIHDHGLLEFPKRNDNLSCRVTFINDDGDKVLHITDFRELGYEYNKYRGGDYIRCCECGILMPNNKYKKKRYCSKCSGYHVEGKRFIVCCDCGKEFYVDSKNRKTNRCEECYAEYRKSYYRDNKRKQREKEKAENNYEEYEEDVIE